MYRPLVVNSLAFNFLLGGPGGVLQQREDDVVPQGLPDPRIRALPAQW